MVFKWTKNTWRSTISSATVLLGTLRYIWNIEAFPNFNILVILPPKLCVMVIKLVGYWSSTPSFEWMRRPFSQHFCWISFMFKMLWCVVFFCLILLVLEEWAKHKMAFNWHSSLNQIEYQFAKILEWSLSNCPKCPKAFQRLWEKIEPINLDFSIFL